MQTKILILGGSNSQLFIYEKAKSLGIYTICLDYLKNSPGHKIADESYLISTTDKKKVLQISKKLNIKAIIPYSSDPAALTASYVGQKLNLHHNPLNAVSIMTNKYKFRNFLKKEKFNFPKFQKFSSIKNAVKFFYDNNKKVVIKPVDSSGSKGVSIVTKKSQMGKAYIFAIKYSKIKDVILEEYIENDSSQIAGDGYVVNGKLSFMALAKENFKKKGIKTVPIGESFPFTRDKKIRNNIFKEINKFIKKINFKFGPINLDIKIYNNKIYLMEIGPRNGGNLIPQAIRHHKNVDLVEATINSYLGKKVSFKKKFKEKFCATFIANSAISGFFKKIVISKKIKNNIKEYYIWKKKGERIDKFNNASMGVGGFVLKFNSQREMDMKFDKIEKYIKVVV